MNFDRFKNFYDCLAVESQAKIRGDFICNLRDDFSVPRIMIMYLQRIVIKK